MSRPSDFVDAYNSAELSEDSSPKGEIQQPRLGFTGWIRWGWRQLTSMKTALLLLLLLAVAAVPGSLFPQRTADPNGVIVYFNEHPDLAPFLDSLQLFDVYGSVWFSSVYLLLFVSLIGCILPRTKHHWQALRSEPPRTPVRLAKTHGYQQQVFQLNETTAEDVLQAGRELLKKKRYRLRELDETRKSADGEPSGPWQRSLSAERGYWRETGNLLFHISLVGVLITVAIGVSVGYQGQRLLVTGQTFANTLSAYDSFNPGRFFSESSLKPYALTLEDLEVVYETEDPQAFGIPLDYTATVNTRLIGQQAVPGEVKVNYPLSIGETDIYLLGNGYAPTLTVRNSEGVVVFKDSVPFLPQDVYLTSVGVVKVPDGLPEQLGMQGFFYPTQAELSNGAYTSAFPDLLDPLLTLNVFQGDLGIDEGIPRSVYTLDTTDLLQVAGGDTGVEALTLKPGETVDLPNGFGTITLEEIPRFASFDIHHDPAQLGVLFFALLATFGLLTSLFIPRRRIWIRLKTQDDGTLLAEYGGLARSEDPGLLEAVSEVAEQHTILSQSNKIV